MAMVAVIDALSDYLIRQRLNHFTHDDGPTFKYASVLRLIRQNSMILELRTRVSRAEKVIPLQYWMTLWNNRFVDLLIRRASGSRQWSFLKVREGYNDSITLLSTPTSDYRFENETHD